MSTWTEVALQPVTRLRELIATRQVSPLELVKACLAQVEKWNPKINALVTLSAEVLNDAREAEESLMSGQEVGLLHGIPVGIKEVTPVRGLRTTYGSTVYADHVPRRDALVVERLRRAGAIIMGKTNASEFAAGANTFNDVFGRTRNPWDVELTPGGSTGGGGAGLATGMFGVAEGTDLGGSLRIPAAFCGVVGLRPSPGLIPTVPSDYLWDTLQVTGPMARTAGDLALVLQALAGASSQCPVGVPAEGRDFMAAMESGMAPSSLRLAYEPDVAGIGVDPEIEECCRKCVEALQTLGATVGEAKMDLSSGRDAFVALRGHWMVSHHMARVEHLESFGPNLAGNIRSGLAQDPARLGRAEQVRSRIWEMFMRFFDRYQFLLTPTVAVPPFPSEQNYPESIAGKKMETYIDWIAPTFVLSLTGLPVVSVPCGVDSRGLPVGIQIVGAAHDEEGVLKLAKLIQESHPVGLPRESE